MRSGQVWKGILLALYLQMFTFLPDNKPLEVGSRCCVILQLPQRLAWYTTCSSLAIGILSHRSKFIGGG